MKFSEIVSTYLKFFGYVFIASVSISALDSILNLAFPIEKAISNYIDSSIVVAILTTAILFTYAYVVEKGIYKLYIPTLHALLGKHHELYNESEKSAAVKNVIWGVTFFVACQIFFSFSITYFMRDTTSEIIVGKPILGDTEKAKNAGDSAKNITVSQLKENLIEAKRDEETAIANAKLQHNHLFSEMGKTNGWAEKEWAKIKNKATSKIKTRKETINAAIIAAQNDPATLLVLNEIKRKNDLETKLFEHKTKSFSTLLMWIAVSCLIIALLTGWIIANFNRAFDDGSFEQLIPKPKNVTQKREKETENGVPHVTHENTPKNDQDVTREVISRWCSDARLYFERYVSQTNKQFKEDNFNRYLKLAEKLRTVGIFCKIENEELILVNEKEVKSKTPKAQAKEVEFDIVA